MKKIILVLLLFCCSLLASSEYEEGKLVFEKKCASCHSGFIEMNKLKENFFFKDNKLLNLKAPTVNMMVYAIMDSPKKIGDENDVEMRQIEIEEYLKSYLEKPDRFNSICDEHIMRYYDEKPSMKGQLSDDDYINLSYFFMEYEENNIHMRKKLTESNIDEQAIINKAKKNNNFIMVYATSLGCYFCKKMEKEVLTQEDIKKQIARNYEYIKIDVDKNSLPFGLQEKYKKITPSFFVLDSEGKYITQYPGSWNKKDFKEILKENLK